MKGVSLEAPICSHNSSVESPASYNAAALLFSLSSLLFSYSSGVMFYSLSFCSFAASSAATSVSLLIVPFLTI